MTEKKKRSPFVKLLIVAAVFGLVGASIQYLPRLAYQVFGDMWLTEEPGGMSPEQLKAVQQALGKTKCRIVWSSSRSGNHELYLMALPDGNLYRLTNNDYVDFFPRFSPDGGRLAFSRSQKNWVSERDYDPWNVWMLDLLTGEEKMVAKDANYPLWLDDKHISFLRRMLVVVKNLETGEEKVVFDGEKPPVEGRIVTPMLSPKDNNLLAVTARGKLRCVMVVDLRKSGEFTNFGSGCELLFTPDGKDLIWVRDGGVGGTRVMTSPVSKVKPKVFMDLPGEYSHEYFPRLSPDGKWLVWAASAGGHEHDIADYELFLWQVGQPFDRAVRITHSKANDRWPDIYVE